MKINKNKIQKTSYEKTTKSNLMKIFLTCITLTSLSFILIMQKFLNKKILITCIILNTIIQVLIQCIYFLYFEILSKDTKQWQLISSIFTATIITIFTTGSLWIMKHLHNNLML
ncbi:MAG: cytochrome bo3 ubiquinol oxidase subunit 4 [Candidatus Westeberhardia cardiocondylae]|nr:cytochrome bo3 ubiquinol oxidase subunit 4 [Candidatus Westeberhardia cardiocondylae]